MNREEYREFFESEFLWINGFRRNAARYGKRMALTDPAKRRVWTYEELDADTDRFASALEQDGFRKGDGLMYALGNGYEFCFCHLAAHKMKGISMPVNYNWAAQEIAYAIDDSRPFAFVYDTEISEKILQGLEMAEHKPALVIRTGADFDGYVEKGSAPYINGETGNMYDEVLRLYTSGTTGRAKGVPLNNINEIMSAHDVCMHFPLSPKDITMNLTPWFHRGGIHSGGLTPSLYAGAGLVCVRKFNPRQALNFVEEYGVSFIIGAPAVLKLVAMQQERDRKEISTLKGLVSMGSPLEKKDCAYLMDILTPRIFNGYGTSESFWNTFLRPYDLPDHAGSAGGSGTFDDVRLVKSYADRRAEPDELAAKDGREVGEIIIKCPEKMSYTYVNNPQETEAKFYKGFLYTGDQGTWDGDSVVTIAGRRDDMIIVSGENIYPVQIEEAVMDSPMVRDCIVTSAKDRIRGEAVVAYVVPEGDDIDIRALVEFMARHPNISTYKRPRYYGIIDKVPYNATGKKLHYVAREKAAADLREGKLIRA